MYVKYNTKHLFLADYLAFAIHLISIIERVKFSRLDVSDFMNNGNKVYTQLGPLKRSVLSRGQPIDLNVCFLTSAALLICKFSLHIEQSHLLPRIKYLTSES